MIETESPLSALVADALLAHLDARGTRSKQEDEMTTDGIEIHNWHMSAKDSA